MSEITLSLKNKSKTHCPRAHEYSDSNTRVYKGKRICKTCERERSARRYAVKLSLPPKNHKIRQYEKVRGTWAKSVEKLVSSNGVPFLDKQLTDITTDEKEIAYWEQVLIKKNLPYVILSVYKQDKTANLKQGRERKDLGFIIMCDMKKMYGGRK